MNTLFKCVVAAAFISVISAKFVYKDCGSQVGKLVNVTVTGCNNSPCQVKKGNSYTIKVAFNSTESTDQAHAIVHGILDGISVAYPIDNPDGCKESGINCPIKSGSTYVYTSSLKILNAYPEVKVVVKWELADAASGGNDLFCFETLVQVVG